MPKKTVNICNVPDLKREDGSWVRSYCITDETNVYQHNTRAGNLWGMVYSRGSLGGWFQIKNKNYLGCTLGFSGFQEFASWCQSKYGYLHKENSGKYWSIDKDIKIPGNKEYGPDTCMFVPLKVNNCFTRTTRHHPDDDGLPSGVTRTRRSDRFQTCFSLDGVDTYSYGYQDPIDAHFAWKRGKTEEIERLSMVKEYGPEVRNALSYRAELLRAELTGKIVTFNNS